MAALLSPLERAARQPVAAPESPPADTSRDLVTDAIRRMEDPTLKLVRVPDLVRALAGHISIDAIHRALTDAAESGAIELRPVWG